MHDLPHVRSVARFTLRPFARLAAWFVASQLCLSAVALAGPHDSGQHDPGQQQAARLRAAYPDAPIRIEPGLTPLSLRIGDTLLPFSTPEGCVDAATLVRDGQLRDLPLCAMFSQPYPAGSGGREPAPGFDPGRIRNEALLKSLYGHTRHEVEEACVPVSFLGRTVRFNTRHGAAAALARVEARIRPLLDEARIRDWVLPVDDGQYWRVIAGSGRLSAHAFGIAIDLAPDRAPYWRWQVTPEQLAQTRRDYPQEIVDAFEAEGFIWGGKWSAFDFMHFEYRPELIFGRHL